MTTIVVPTYNERENCEQLLVEIFSALPDAHVIFVDDHSPDGTAVVVRNAAQKNSNILLVERTGQRSFAQSYCDGFLLALRNGADIIIQMDADLSHNPSDVPRLIQTLERADCAIGSRYCHNGGTIGWSRTRMVISRIGNWYAAQACGLPFRDSTAGFMAWKAPLLASIIEKPFASNSYAFLIELKERAWKKGARIVEVPIVFKERKNGVSKMNFNTLFEAIRCISSLKKKL